MMLWKMRWRFIGAAMLAFLAVALVFVAAVNIWNYQIITRSQDDTLTIIAEFDGQGLPPVGADGIPAPGFFAEPSMEARYMLRFFDVHCDEEGHILNLNQDYIASVDKKAAQDFVSGVLERGKTNGYYKGYRYLIEPDDNGTRLIFLNAERELRFFKSVFALSVIIALFALLIVFALVVPLSKRAIAPFVRNIEAQKRFITDAGHELKTPLTAITTSADVLAYELEDNEWVQNIQHQSSRMARLINHLVTLSRLDESQPRFEKSTFSLSDAVWETSEPVAGLAAAKGKSYSADIADGINFHGDKGTIQQMVAILLDNALKYSDPGGTIRLILRRRQRKIELIVENTCILPKDLDTTRLFERFYRTDTARSGGESFGIGLSIAKAVVENHNGSITATPVGDHALRMTVLFDA